MERLKLGEINFDELEEMVGKWLNARTKLVTHKQITFTKPEQKLYYTPESYATYRELVEVYNKSITEWEEQGSLLKSDIDYFEALIKKAIPALMWFKITFAYRPLWVGIQSSNWGGGDRTIRISESEPIEKLEHIIHN